MKNIVLIPFLLVISLSISFISNEKQGEYQESEAPTSDICLTCVREGGG